MRVCLIGDGRSIHLKRWSQWLRTHGNEVVMLSVLPFQDADSKSYDRAIQVKDGTGLMSMIRARKRVRRIVSELKPDVVHGHYLTSGGYLAGESGAGWIIASAWGSDVYVDIEESSAKRRLARSAIINSDWVFADTDHLCNAVTSFHPGTNVAKVVFGVDPLNFKPKKELRPGKFTFISIRFTKPIYNPILILQAFERIAVDRDFELQIQEVLDGNRGISEKLASSPIKSKLRFFPFTKHEKICDLINSAHVAISAPNTDSSAASMLEAMACEVPVIASDIPQNREWIVDCVDGYLFKPGSVDDLAAKMLAAADNQDLNKMGENARRKVVEKASFDTEMKKALSIYEQGAKSG